MYSNLATAFPSIVNVNVLTGICPCRCVHCPVGKTDVSGREASFGKTEMDFEIFKMIVSEIARYNNSSIRIHSVGEPLCWSKIADASHYCYDKQVKSWLFTCAVNDDRNLLKHLCDHLSIIEVSVNSVDAKDYRATKGIDAFALVESNIIMMSEYIKTNELPARLLLSRVQSDSKSEDDNFVQTWKSKNIAADVFVRSYHNYNNIIETKSAEEKKPCIVHWSRASIDTDGSMVVCFNELFKKRSQDIILGSISSGQKIAGIWNSAKMREIREADLHETLNSLNYYLPCKTCTSCQPLDSARETSEKQLALIKNGVR